MNESSSSDQAGQPTVTEADPEAYKRLCKVVKAGTFTGITFSPWHKGCDFDLDATCRWPELKDVLETWYFDRRENCDVLMHTRARITPSFDGEELIFEMDADWDRSMDQMSEVGENWDVEEFQKFVFGLLPPKLSKQTTPEDLWISVEVDYDGDRKKTSLSGLSISVAGDENDAMLAAITPLHQKKIGDYVMKWCQGTHGPENNFTVSIENSEVNEVGSSTSEEFLVVPSKSTNQG
jgi:hypothetical protein